MSEAMGLKKERKIEENSAWQELMPRKIQCEKINRNCALRVSYAYFCDRHRQYEDKELWKRQQMRHIIEPFS